MRFRMLGPLEVWSGTGWTPISAAKWRALLACLLLRQGRLVSTESLILELWGDSPPAKANNLVSIYVHRLRRLIGDAEGKVLVYRAPGYLLRIDPGDLDLQEFESLVEDGRSALAAADPESAATLLAEALALWRGPLLADVPQSGDIAAEAVRAGELRLTAAELRIEADLACGRSGRVVPELRGLVAENPLRERLWLLLMRALSDAGRNAEALEAYAQVRQVISDELGVEPDAELQQFHAQLLAADASSAPPGKRPHPSPHPSERAVKASPATEATSRQQAREVPEASDRPAAAEDAAAEDFLGQAAGTIAMGTLAEAASAPAVAAAAAESAEPPVARPAQLPADIGDFTGRDAHIKHLCDMLIRDDGQTSPGAVRIAVVAGAAGLGKTTLAVHAAHQVRGLFPDGQLYVDLSGASAQPAAPGEVLARFLRDLGVDGDKVPVGDEERAALYRTRLTGRRVLVLLDNAKDAAQVRPLLPGSASCAVLVTTRNRTPDLASTRFFDLDVLEDTEALALFSRIVGDERPAAEPDATAEVLVACAGLPLAIRICGARIAARRQWKIATMAARLRDEHSRLDELETGDLAVRASFQVSYDSLRSGRYGVDPARTFRLLGLWQGRSISLPAAAALVGEGAARVADALETLVDANLLESPAPDWYQFHDLLRFYATERAQAEESEAAREEAVTRLLRWYVGTAVAAADAIAPQRYREPMGDLPDMTASSPVMSVEGALAWYESARENVLAAIRQAAAFGLSDVAWVLAANLYAMFNRRDNWADCVTAHRIALESARHAGRRLGEAWVLRNLGSALVHVGDIEGLGHLERALAIRQELGDRIGEAQTAMDLAIAYHNLQGPEISLEHLLSSLKLVREYQSSLYGMALNNLGEYYHELGNLEDAADYFEQARVHFRTIGPSYGEGHALHNLGHVYLDLGRHADALGHLRQALEIHRSTGDLMGQALALMYTGEAQVALGETAAARTSWSAALLTFRELGDEVQAAKVQELLRSLTGE
jgi:DNA-binding SARP family transcriptional activator/tetratricopeptide (TPR) repeat protein